MTEALSALTSRDLGRLAEEFAVIALEAGAAIMRVYGRGCAIWQKADRTPVTEADEIGESIVLAALARVLPGMPVVAEEAFSCGRQPSAAREFILVDALDGTREFLKRNGEFTVNLALVRDGAPVCGVVFAPALRRIWLGADEAYGAEIAADGRLPPRGRFSSLRARPLPDANLVALASRSHTDARTQEFLAGLPVGSLREIGSSIKFCLLANGEADVYARFGPTMEWDTAAGDAILRAAGGGVEDVHGQRLRYGKQAQGFRNPNFVAWGAPPSAA